VRYTYIGAGGIGGLQGCWMARAGVDVTFVDRWVEHVQAINAGGMYIDGSRGRHRITVNAITPDRLAEIAPLEAVVVAVKSQDTRAALEQLLPYSTQETLFVSMQAGMNLPILASVVGPARSIGADPNYGGALVNPGHLEAGFPNYIHVGEMDGRFTPRLRRLREDLTHWTPTYMTDNIVGTVWSKFAYGSQIVCTAITDLPSGEALADPRHRLIAGALVREAIRISDRLGVYLEPFDFFDPDPYRVETAQDAEGLLFWIEHAWPRHEVFRKWSNHTFVKTGSGMRWDIAHRRRASETTAMMQALIDEAGRAGLAMPLNLALLGVIQEIERGERALTAANFDDLLRVIEREGQSLPVPA
jgi:2-dehydropantoate 2-reductase